MKKVLVFMFFALVVSCGGGGGGEASIPASVPYKTVMSVDGTAKGFNASASFVPPSTIEQEVAQQASLPGDVILTMNPFRSGTFEHLPEYLTAAKAYSNIKWVYLFDEMFWTGSQIAMGLYSESVSAAAAQVRAAGYKSAVTLMPDVIMQPDFKLDTEAFDVVLIDVYPQAYPVWPDGSHQSTYGCSYNKNLGTTILACSILALRNAGYTGEIWYVYQGFWIAEPKTEALLIDQRETIRDAAGLGVTGLVAFGLFVNHSIGLEPPLIPGMGSMFEHLLLPP